MEEFFQIGVIGLIKAIDSFNLEKGIKFSTYVSRCIENEILMFLRKTKKFQKEISFEEEVANDNEGNCLNLIDVLIDESVNYVADFEQGLIYQRIREILDELPERQKVIMVMFYGFEGRRYSQQEIAERVGLTQSYVSRVIKSTLLIFKRILVCEEYVDCQKKTIQKKGGKQ